VVWLLGKTGSGKSSLIRAMTGLSEVEIGNGFMACTKTARRFDFPAERPVMRFLDTRGLGEASYDPADDLAAAESGSHVIIVLARLDDPVQGEIANVLAKVRRRERDIPVIVAHSASDLLPDDQERGRVRHHTQSTLEVVMKRKLPAVELDLSQATDESVASLLPLLREIMPEVALLLARETFDDAEKAQWLEHRAEVLWYAGAASTADAVPLPLAGGLTATAIQGRMLQVLAGHYGVEWTRSRMMKFSAALGTGIAIRLGAGFGLRQAVKFVPVLGQTVGAAASGAMSFAVTYALGRAGARYLYSAGRNETVSSQELRAVFAAALKQSRP
jgi:uncharacterized protein (DUF697 family)